MPATTDIHIRIPVDLHERLRELAEREQRSLNNLIVLLLRRAADQAAE